MPTGTGWSVTAVELPGPVTVVGPLPRSGSSRRGTAVAPVSPLSTVLTSVSRGLDRRCW